MDRQKLHKELRKHFSSTDAERVAPWVLPAIGFHDGNLGDEPADIGTTRFGGRPDLANSISWPTGPDGPLAFLGQIALREVRVFDVDAVFPTDGLLSFFFNIRDYAWGIFPDDAKKFAIVFQTNVSNLQRREFPSDIHSDNRLTQVRRVKPYLMWELPTSDPLAQSKIGFKDSPDWDELGKDKFTDAYWKMEAELTKPHIPVGVHKLLGWANGMYHQGTDTRLICEVARRGFPKEGSSEFANAIKGRDEWRCLLEISDDDDLYDDVWGDGGTIAFMIRDSDLKQRNFAASWCVVST